MIHSFCLVELILKLYCCVVVMSLLGYINGQLLRRFDHVKERYMIYLMA